MTTNGVYVRYRIPIAYSALRFSIFEKRKKKPPFLSIGVELDSLVVDVGRLSQKFTFDTTT